MGRRRKSKIAGVDSDVPLVQGTLKNDIRIGGMGQYNIMPAGQKVTIARIIRSPIGLMFRLMGTTIWVGETDIEAVFEPKQVYDYTKTHPEDWKQAKTNKKTKKTKKSDKQNTKQCKQTKTFDTKRYTPRVKANKTGVKGMNKQELKQVLAGLQPGDTISLTFIGDRAGASGEYLVKGTKTGRGKGGSLLVELEDSEGELIVTGTPESHMILNITDPEGTLHGFEHEADLPPVFETDAENATFLKEQFANLMDADGQYTVAVESTYEPFNGTFTVMEAKQLRGRYGQIVLTLQADREPVKVWSYRHSGAIKSFTLLGTDEAEEEAEETE